MKKLLSLVLALALVLTAVTAFAVDFEVTENQESATEKGSTSTGARIGSGGNSISSGAQYVITIINIDNSTNGSYNQVQGTTTTTTKEIYTSTQDVKENNNSTYTFVDKDYNTSTSTYNTNVSNTATSTYTEKDYNTSTSTYNTNVSNTSTSTYNSNISNTSTSTYDRDYKDTKDYKDLKDYSTNSEIYEYDNSSEYHEYDNSSTYTEKAGDTIYLGSFNDQSIRDSYNDNSVTEANTTEANTTTTTQNTDSGNSSASASASAAAAAGETKKSAGSGSGSGSASKSSGSASGSSSAGGSSASSSAKAVAVAKASSSGSGSGSSSSSTVVAPSIQLVVVPDTAETTALKNAFAEAIKAGDPKTALPENISSKLSADLKTVNEFVTAKLVGDITGIASATVNIQFPTKYAAGDKVVVLFGIPNGDTTQWINVNGIIESDGSISMILTSTVLEALAGKTFALAVLSK